MKIYRSNPTYYKRIEHVLWSLSFMIATLLSSALHAQVTWPSDTNYVYFGSPNLNHSNAGNYSLLQHKTSGWTFLNSPDRIHFRIGNVNKMFLDSAGNVGIGTTAPTVKLDVYGHIRIDGPNVRDDMEFQTLNGYNRVLFNELRFYDANLVNGEMMTLNEGRVGIGTTTPDATLHVVKNASSGYSWTPIAGTTAIFEGTEANRSFITVVGKSTAQSEIFFGDEDVQNQGRIRYEHNTNTLNFWTNHATRMTISNGGLVGIGTNIPSAKLHVADGNTYLVSNTNTSNTDDNVFTGSTFFNRYGDDNNPYAYIQAGNQNKSAKAGFVFRTSNTNDWQWVDAMIIDTDGKVGIGTTSPDSELAVNGTIHTKEIKVKTTGWPDYVFAKDYRLSSLNDIEAYINEKGHLPNIPSAEDVAVNGIHLGEMNAKLLQKIEELTLHLIEIKKENTAMKQANEEFRKRLEALESN